MVLLTGSLAAGWWRTIAAPLGNVLAACAVTNSATELHALPMTIALVESAEATACSAPPSHAAARAAPGLGLAAATALAALALAVACCETARHVEGAPLALPASARAALAACGCRMALLAPRMTTASAAIVGAMACSARPSGATAVAAPATTPTSCCRTVALAPGVPRAAAASACAAFAATLCRMMLRARGTPTVRAAIVTAAACWARRPVAPASALLLGRGICCPTAGLAERMVLAALVSARAASAAGSYRTRQCAPQTTIASAAAATGTVFLGHLWLAAAIAARD